MKKQMLIVKGSGSVGKSASVKLAFGMLLRWILQKELGATVQYLYWTNREVAAAIQVGAVCVGIATRGDNEREVSKALSFFFDQKCKVIVCATRSKGKPLEVARTFSTQRLKAPPEGWVKSAETDRQKHEAANRAFARKIVKWIKSASH
jgi:hypothetical protein